MELCLLGSGRYKDMQASTCGLVPHSSATSASVLASRLVEKFLSFLWFLFSARLGGPERGQGPNHCVNQSSTTDKCCSFLFSFLLPGGFFRNKTEKQQQKNHLTCYFQAHPVPSQGKKSTEQHLFIKSLFSCPCLFLAAFS